MTKLVDNKHDKEIWDLKQRRYTRKELCVKFNIKDGRLKYILRRYKATLDEQPNPKPENLELPLVGDGIAIKAVNRKAPKPSKKVVRKENKLKPYERMTKICRETGVWAHGTFGRYTNVILPS